MPEARHAAADGARADRDHALALLAEHLGDEALALEFEPALSVVVLEAGEVLFEAGSRSDAYYILTRGGLEARVHGGETWSSNLIEAGQGFGELGLLGQRARSATIVALRRSQILRVPQVSFERLLERSSVFSRALLQRAVELAVEGVGAPQNPQRSAAVFNATVIIAGDRDPATRRSCHALAREIAALGRSSVVTPTRVEQALGLEGCTEVEFDGALHWRIEEWLDATRRAELERQAAASIPPEPPLLLDAEPRICAWSRRCLERAAHVIWVTRDGWSAFDALTPHARHAARRSLVRLHPPSAKLPGPTSTWLGQRCFEQVLHVRAEDPGELPRVARSLTGRGVGVVFSGGAALGAAHVGMLRALREAEIPIDYVGGTSIGASVAALVAMGWEPARIEAAGELLLTGRPMGRMGIPLGSLYSRKGIDRRLRSLFGEARCEDLWRPYFCVSSNLSQGRQKIHDRGSVWRAVRASSAMPGILPPMIEDGQLFVDGALFANVPGREMKRRCGGPLVCLKTTGSQQLEVDYAYEQQPSAGRLLWSRINPFMERIEVPSIRSVMTRSLMLASHGEGRRALALADIVLAPDLRGYGVGDFKAFSTLVELGYAHAARELEGCDLSALRGAR